MIGSLTGTVEHVGTDSVLLNVHGVGYRVFVLPAILAAANPGASLTVYTHVNVREDDLSLFGFRTMRELAFFQLLLQAPGVGPKTGLAVMAIADVDVLMRAIVSGDVSLLTQVSGIGKRTAERIVVELRTRLEKEQPALAGKGGTAHADVVSALVNLGYSVAEAHTAVRALPPDLSTAEEGIRMALKAIGARAER